MLRNIIKCFYMQLLLFNANIILCNDNVEINNFYKFENPIIKLKNFIVTQRINYPFHKAYYSKEHNFKPCNTNLAIQLSDWRVQEKIWSKIELKNHTRKKNEIRERYSYEGNLKEVWVSSPAESKTWVNATNITEKV